MEQIVELSEQVLKGYIDSAIDAIRRDGLQSYAVSVLELCLKGFNSREECCIKFIDQYAEQEDLLSYNKDGISQSVLLDFSRLLGKQSNTILLQKSTEMMQHFVCDLIERGDSSDIQIQDDVDLFSFRPVSEYLLSELAENEISVSSPETFNDPFDCLILSAIRNEQERLDEIKKRYYAKTYVDELQKVRVRCFFGWQDDMITQPYLKNLMWGHYAKNHQGICIKYTLTTKKPILTNGIVEPSVRARLDKVSYREGYVRKKGSLEYDECFLVKDSDWEYENEFRLVYYDANKGNLHYQVPLESLGLRIDAIYFGLNCTTSNRNLIKKLLKGKDVNFYTIKRNRGYLNKIYAQPDKVV